MTVRGERLGFLGKSAFFGEGPIIEGPATGKGGCNMQIRGRSIRATVDTQLGYLCREEVEELISKQGFPEIQVRLASFHKAGAKLSKKSYVWDQVKSIQRGDPHLANQHAMMRNQAEMLQNQQGLKGEEDIWRTEMEQKQAGLEVKLDEALGLIRKLAGVGPPPAVQATLGQRQAVGRGRGGAGRGSGGVGPAAQPAAVL